TDRNDRVDSYVLVSITQSQKLISVEHIREIVPFMALEEKEGGGSFRGLLNLRGEIIPIFDLDGGPLRRLPDRYILISVSDDGTPLGLIVDDVHDIISIEGAEIARRPIGGGRIELFTLLEENVVAVFDPREIIQNAA
ncbi:MAG: chemotaxis protein CheW, partial [Planctomycetota bacterium]|nr:chemotaxis protein CheW [Planctomycetota bacterium]